MIKQTVTQLLETEMERKDFLKLLALGALAAIGVSQILKALSHHTAARPASSPQGVGYGASVYGGDARR